MQIKDYTVRTQNFKLNDNDRRMLSEFYSHFDYDSFEKHKKEQERRAKDDPSYEKAIADIRRLIEKFNNSQPVVAKSAPAKKITPDKKSTPKPVDPEAAKELPRKTRKYL